MNPATSSRLAPRVGARRYHPRLETLEDRLAPAILPPGFQEAPIAAGLAGATAMEIAPDGRLWVLEQAGDVEVFHAGSTAGFTALDLPASAINANGERGLLGIAFDPSYDIASPAADFVYLYYTSSPNPHNRISRFTVNNANPDQPSLSGERVILELDPLSATNHNGGAIHFGPDGKLYVAVGDNAVGNNAQMLTTLHGKMLRINADGSIPADNPFVNVAIGKNQAIWALGLRNPFTFAFQPGTGRMFINDVGEGTFEEINDGAAGANYGWPSTEGDFNPGQFPGFVRPFYAYAHGGGTFQGFAITGGAFYNPASPGAGAFPAQFIGDYFFADFVNDWINVIDTSTRSVSRFATGASGAVDLRVAADGSLWYLARGEGQVQRVVFTGVSEPTPTFAARINFQTASSRGFRGYQADIGAVFGLRPSGLSFGWNIDNSATARNRNAPVSPDERYDTFQRLNPGAVWEIAVPNGTYGVRIVAGDPVSLGSIFRIDVEGVPALRGRPNAARRWLDRTVVVTVSDGRLTVTGAPGARNNKINFIEIGAAPFRQAKSGLGLVAIEAENFASRLPRGGHAWTFLTSPGGFSGSGVMQAAPNIGASRAPNHSPRLDYKVRFVKPGIHYVWIRGFAQTAGDDTLHVGLDGLPSARLTGLRPNFTWSKNALGGGVATIFVATPGVHTLNLWMQEDGAVIDKIVLTTSAAYRPTGIGPAESIRS